MHTKRKISPLRISSFFCPKLGEDQKKTKKTRSSFRFSLVFGPKLGEDPPKKRSSLRFGMVFARKVGEDQKNKQKKALQSDVFVLKLFAQVTKGGAMPQFYIILYANFAILATQRGGHGTMSPLNTPLLTAFEALEDQFLRRDYRLHQRLPPQSGGARVVNGPTSSGLNTTEPEK